jgi:uncharacterized protein (DUF983 family)
MEVWCGARILRTYDTARYRNTMQHYRLRKKSAVDSIAGELARRARVQAGLGRQALVLVFWGNGQWQTRGGASYHNVIRRALEKQNNVVVVDTVEAYTSKCCSKCADPVCQVWHPFAAERTNAGDGRTYRPAVRGLSECAVCGASMGRDLSAAKLLAVCVAHTLRTGLTHPVQQSRSGPKWREYLVQRVSPLVPVIDEALTARDLERFLVRHLRRKRLKDHDPAI